MLSLRQRVPHLIRVQTYCEKPTTLRESCYDEVGAGSCLNPARVSDPRRTATFPSTNYYLVRRDMQCQIVVIIIIIIIVVEYDHGIKLNRSRNFNNFSRNIMTSNTTFQFLFVTDNKLIFSHVFLVQFL